MRYLEPTTSALFAKHPKWTILGYSETDKKRQNGTFLVSEVTNMTQGLEESHGNHSGQYLEAIVYLKRDRGTLLKDVGSLEPTTFFLPIKYTKVFILG